jgi:hypothetical protein
MGYGDHTRQRAACVYLLKTAYDHLAYRTCGCIHTREVVGSIPTAPTIEVHVTRPFFIRGLATQNNSERNEA